MAPARASAAHGLADVYKRQLSTCGLTDKIDKLAEHGLQLTLSVSLHAPDDETRSRIMPVNRSVGVEKLFAACRRYFEVTGRRISYEYALQMCISDRSVTFV